MEREKWTKTQLKKAVHLVKKEGVSKREVTKQRNIHENSKEKIRNGKFFKGRVMSIISFRKSCRGIINVEYYKATCHLISLNIFNHGNITFNLAIRIERKF